MQWFEEVAEYLEPETVYTHKELVAFIKTHYPYVSQGSYHWGINSMMKCGKLARIGYDQYRRADGTEREYAPNYTKSTQTLIKRITRKFPGIAFTVFETELLNEFLDQPVSDSIVYIQVEKAQAEVVFRFLHERYDYHLLFRPSKKDFEVYQRSGCIVITNLISESPLKYGNPHDIRIEKMLVDIYCDKIISCLLDSERLVELYYKADELYTLDKPGLLRYANRRGKKKDIEGMASEIFERELSIEEKINSDKSKICSAAQAIIESLPESQQLLFEYINCGMTQPQLKDALEVSPQAVDQRLDRLFKTLVREIEKKYGFTEEYIRKIYLYRSEFYILRRLSGFI